MQGIKIKLAASILGLSDKKLFQYLRDKKILNRNNIAYECYRESRYFIIDHRRWEDHERQQYRDYYITLITDKGIEFVRLLLEQDGLINRKVEQ